jgi:pimeloyl-ACP methyl ester carboxylesterase
MQKNDSRWSAAEMGAVKSREPKTSAMRDIEELDIVDVSSDDPSGKPLTCKFSLHYSFIKPSNPNSQTPKNILYIPGGPGTIVELEDVDPDKDRGGVNALEILENAGDNVAYLHVRGSGSSPIPQSNKFDRFLRANYVVEDIERLRRYLLGNDTPWDAVWGESHGALVAQRYAYKYGTDKVKKLILIGPPSRSEDTHDPRRKMMVANLAAILSYYPDVFGFLTDKTINEIKNTLGTMLEILEEEFGSINFVIENYRDLKLTNVVAAVGRAKEYPLEFFRALQYLSFHGRPVKGLELEDLPRLKQVDAAILIAHYLMLFPSTPGNRGAGSAETMAPAFLSGLDQDSIDAYKERLKEARKRVAIGETKSQRAYWVFGVFDGISRWILKFMKDKVDKDGFFRTEDIKPSLTRANRYFADKIGMVPGEAIYPWNPGYYKHSVPTFILKGGADAVIAGGQAESFFKDGLSNKEDSVLMEIPGMGHIWRTSMPMATFGRKKSEKEGRKVLQELVKEFLRKPSASAFREDPQVKEIIKSLGISFPAASQPSGTEPAKPKIDKLERRKVWDTAMRLRHEGIATPVEKNSRVRAKVSKAKFSRPRPKN